MNFRIAKNKYVTLAPKVSIVKMYGKAYASKEKLYVQQTAFMIPKSSPLKASIIIELNYVNLQQSHHFSETSKWQFPRGWKWEYARRCRMKSLHHKLSVVTLRSLFGQREMHMEISLSLYTMFYHHLWFLVFASYPP